ncbi:MAG: hypothetical protein JSW58_17670 [Candidatus Latescibacterota bacterium]|nr:MAG: hypothetical protein JSW58_17670 [Candidatus Latescibacterota bacterium]
MKRTILLGLGLIFLLGTHVFAGERLVREARTYPKDMKYARGKKGRKYVRRLSLRENLSNDKLMIYDTLGYTPHRLRYNHAGERTERWKYYSLGVEYWFDEGGYLIETRRFPPEANHID